MRLFRGDPLFASLDTIRGSLPDPAFFCARAFTRYLNQNGVTVSGEPTTDRLLAAAGQSIPQERQAVFMQQSDSLGSIIVLTNHKSVNLRAECIHRMVGLEALGKGTLDAAETATRDHWNAKGIDMTGYYMADGSGLSRSNTVTARQMALILYQASKGEHFSTFYNSLPVAGQSGTLASIGKGNSAEGRVRAKSGTLDRIRNYAGYVNARSGERYAFALFVNNCTCELWEVKSKIVRVWSKLVAL